MQRGSVNYDFWPDGSLKSDDNEQISNINYDTFLQQPTQIQITDGRTINHYYDGGGKLLKTVYSNGEIWEFGNGMIYKNGQPYQMAMPEGRAIYNAPSGGWGLEFSYTDHLGNTRVSFKANGNQLEKVAETAFDPWGVVLNGLGQTNTFQNRFEMQGKESEKTFGLNRINFGARTVNPTTGVFDRIDPLADLDFQLSPYAYAGNNPLMFIDPTGMKRVDIDGSKNYYDDETGELTIVGQKPKSDPLLGNMFINYAQNYERTGNASPAGKYFREGGTDAAMIIGAPLTAIGAAEIGLGALVFDSELLAVLARRSTGRKLLRSMLAKGGINLLGQAAGSMWSGDAAKGKYKLDLTGLGADMLFTNGATSLVGGVGEAGLEYENGWFSRYGDINSEGLGAAKFTSGFLFGKYGGQATEFMGSNGVSNAMVGMYESLFKLFNEALNQGATKIDEGVKSQNSKK